MGSFDWHITTIFCTWLGYLGPCSCPSLWFPSDVGLGSTTKEVGSVELPDPGWSPFIIIILKVVPLKRGVSYAHFFTDVFWHSISRKIIHFFRRLVIYNAIHKIKGFETADWNDVQGDVQANGSIYGLWEFFRSTRIQPVEAAKPLAL